ncbi:MAG TPA: flagellar motor protein MotB [Pseudomonadales bacterium]|jgi:outer membrane protein OmpA-like peptidoglycan-associated protein|nr:flagellar motor protein MotB [Pseudomonadales bacterium]HNI73334.1 flagellar motor protein MotB [Accumulibacter sp.]HMW14486.1 flagellar motor protein MotB [Pseudomonadales bacterium]HMW82242.1 flagellar motor protein MotB [Pseudomonadales bacterium]HMY96043.1 flagellar motor protein MotB [Pseudomonadales bacterium]
MFGQSSHAKRRPRDEAEKPFWISYADLMTALMVLFLVVMAVALLAVTKTVSQREQKEAQHRQDIERLLDRFEEVSRQERFRGITINRDRHVVDFGSRAQFPFAKSTLTLEQQQLLRAFVPELLAIASGDLGRRVLKEFVVDGFTDKTGSYLSNLDLSLQRSQRVLCALFAKSGPGETPMTQDQLEQVRALFVVGGYSFNAAKATDEESRRVELRLQFLGIHENRRSTEDVAPGNFGTCALPSS